MDDRNDEAIAVALRPLVDDPLAPPRPVSAIAADARRRRMRRRTVMVAATVVAVLGLAGVVVSLDSSQSVTTADQATTTPRPTPAPTTDGSTSSTDAPGTSATTAPSTTAPTTTATASPTTTASQPDPPPPSGGPGGPYDPFAGLQAEAAGGAAASATTGGAVRLGDGDVLEFADVDFADRLATQVELRVASGVDATTTLHVRLDDPASPPVATATVSGGDDWSAFTTVNVAAVGALGGRHPVYLTAHAATPGDTVAVDWIRFTP